MDAADTVFPVQAIDHEEVPAMAAYSQAVRAGPLLFIAGQIGIGPDGRVTSHDAGEQITQAFRNMGKLLNAVGADFENVVKITQYLVRHEDRAAIPRARGPFFSKPYPASTLLIVKQLASPDYLYEVDAIAVIPPAST